MAPKVAWTNQAKDDLHTVYKFLSTFSDARAEAVIEEIINQVFLLEQFSRMGRVVPELNIEAIRELIVQQYRIVYSLTAQGQIEVLTIRHTSRPLSKI